MPSRPYGRWSRGCGGQIGSILLARGSDEERGGENRADGGMQSSEPVVRFHVAFLFELSRTIRHGVRLVNRAIELTV